MKIVTIIGSALVAASLALAGPAVAHAESGKGRPSVSAGAGAKPAASTVRAGRTATPAPRTGSAIARPTRKPAGAAASTDPTDSADFTESGVAMPPLDPALDAAFFRAIRNGSINWTRPVPGLDPVGVDPTALEQLDGTP